MLDFTSFMNRVEGLGVRIEWARIVGPHAGAYDLASRTIYLDWDLDTRPRHAISTLAHEAAHDHFRDASYGNPWIEQRADAKAAEWLICPSAYRRAEAAYEGDVWSMAVELGVTSGIVRAFQASLARAA